MKEAGDILRIVGIVLLVLFVLAVGVPLVSGGRGRGARHYRDTGRIGDRADQDRDRGGDNLFDHRGNPRGAEIEVCKSDERFAKLEDKLITH